MDKVYLQDFHLRCYSWGMKEIEIKAVLKDKGAVMKKLQGLGCEFSKPIHQDDAVYVERVGDLKTFLSNSVFLRIRVNDNSQVIFTAKQRTGPLVAIEHETIVNSAEELREILFMMSYKKAVEIRKERQVAHYKDYEICIDEVEGLGSFIEMEKLSTDENVEEIQEEMFVFFESLGIKRDDRVTKGYDILLLESGTINA
jgi:adenylate cyclase, class 2